MKTALFFVSALLVSATSALAEPIGPGQTHSGIVVAGTTSIYDIFGHAGNTGGDYGPDSPAILTTFASGASNIFTFSAAGAISCCSDTPNFGPDGGSSSMNVGGINGLSSLSGTTHIPFVGVFTTNTDPFGGSAPAALSFDAANPTGLSPLLNQVFYIGDGRAGYSNPLGSVLQFIAPTSATRLYIGVIDAYSFNGTSGYYNDNKGSFTASVSLSGGAVPEPATWGMMILGFGAVGAGMRRRRQPLISRARI